MESQGKAAMNAAQAQAQAGNAAASTTAAIASAGVARAASTCACGRRGCRACDILGMEHPGEAIVPNALGASPGALALLAELVAEVRALRQDRAQMAKLLSRWDGDGMPTARHHGEMIIPKPPRWDGSGHGEHA